MPASDVPGESGFADAADSGEAAADRARVATRQRISSRPPTRRRNTRRRARISSRQGRRRSQRRSVHAVGLRAPEAPRRDARCVFPGGLGGANWGGTRHRSASRASSSSSRRMSARSAGWRTRARARRAVRTTTPGRGTFDVRIGDSNWPCQKPPWGRLIAVQCGDGRRRVADAARRHRRSCPKASSSTGRPALAGPIVTGERPAVRRLDRRQPLPRDRRHEPAASCG